MSYESDQVEGIIGIGATVAAYGLVNAASGIGSAIGASIRQAADNRAAYAQGRLRARKRIAAEAQKAHHKAEAEGFVVSLIFAARNRALQEAA
jgi:hypothetical protein